MNAAEAQDLSVFYGSTEALKKVNLEVPEAMVYGIIGPDGAGKTTLMRSLCTLLPYSAGSIRVLDYDALDRKSVV